MILTAPKTSTTDMEVTSIRLERELKDKLKDLAGDQGYQALVREVLWKYVQQNLNGKNRIPLKDRIRATLPATARRSEQCALTGDPIASGDPMWLGLVGEGEWIPLRVESL